MGQRAAGAPEQPAAPQATRVRTRPDGSLASCATPEPMAEPSWTIGPARPAAPPKPMVSSAAATSTVATRLTILPPRRTSAIITRGTACPPPPGRRRGSTDRRAGRRASVAAPDRGRQSPTRRRRGGRAKSVMRSSSRRKPTAPQPVSRPTMIARTTRRVCSGRSGTRTDRFAHRGTARQRRGAAFELPLDDSASRSSAISGLRRPPRRAGRPGRRTRWGGNRPSTSGRGRR